MKIYERHNPTPLMANPTGKDRGPNGRCLCKWCGTEVAGRRRSWCSAECVHEYQIRSNAGYARAQVYRRDRGKCALCPRDASKMRGRARRMPYLCRRTYSWLLGLGKTGHIRSLWQADHILPVSEGGGSCGLDNLRTLCVWCHKSETKKLQARLAKRRRVKRAKPSSGNLKDRARGL